MSDEPPPAGEDPGPGWQAVGSGNDGPQDDLEADPALAAAVLEIEHHAADQGWDQPARLYALVDTARLVEAEPALARSLGLDDPGSAGSLTPLEQEGVEDGDLLEQALDGIAWPGEVSGCAAVVERFVLPPGSQADVPEDAGAAARFAREHPDRQEVRIVAGVTRGAGEEDGSAYCALRLRSHDDPQSVVAGPSLVPGLVTLLRSTLEEDSS